MDNLCVMGLCAEVFQRHMSLPDVVRVPKTLKHWISGTALADLFTFNTRELHPDPCRRPTIFYLDKLSRAKDGTIISSYKKSIQNCSSNEAPELIRLVAQRRHCCDILASTVPHLMEIAIRECAEDELIRMQ
ncbi:hypothetical protein VNO78_13955 [Psophocarpus tetragonolobus]|uniref:Uncharacterized protein n=1 Tax=Psophocarpus tetragonolobus TaxID=3891 RepID=A0AAN9SPR7_PSOTE